MKNLKKLLALVLSLAMMVTTFTLPAFAADDATEDNTEATETAEAAVEEPTNAEICFALEVLKGEGHGLTEEYLAKEAPRWNIALMTVRLRGLEDEAMAYDGEDTFADADKMTWVAGRPFLGYLKANPELGWLGRGTDDLFDPEGMMTVQEYYKAMLQVLGYDQGTDFEWAEVMDKAEEVGIAAAGDAEKLTNSIIGDVTVAALKAETKDGKVLAEKLVELGTIDEEVAAKYELVKIAPDAVAVKSAVALDSKIVEVELDEAAEETNAAQFVITDEDDEIVEVESAKLAPWDTDKKTVLVNLAEELKAGDLYKLTSGEAEAKFGGRSKDETKPEVKEVTSTDYNEVVIEFTEAIDLDTLNVKMTKKTGDKEELEILDMVYDGSNKVILTTEEQVRKLYVFEITDATDLAGNEMDDEKSKSCVGTDKPDDAIEVKEATANDYNEVAILFSQRVADVDPSMFTLTNKRAKTEVEVLDAYVATADDYFRDEKIKDCGEDDHLKYVILKVEDLQKSKMFEVKVSDLKSLYDTNIDSDNNKASFVGISKPSDPYEFVSVTPDSNTQITLNFENKIDETTGSDISNYTIKYKDEVLEVLEAEVDGKDVTLTVKSMDRVLYKVTVDNDVMDIYGNKLDSDNDSNNFVGEEVAKKIDKIKSIERINDNQIRVRFDQKIGDNAEDIAFYTINRELGYPIDVEKATKDNGGSDYYKSEVIVTIPKTNSGKVYELTVNEGIENCDGVESTKELKNTFSGLGVKDTLPTIDSADVIDNQTFIVYFDRDVTDSSIKGKIWKSNHSLVPGAVKVDNGSKVIDLSDAKYAGYAYQDPEEDEALIIRIKEKYFKASVSDKRNDTFDLIINERLVESKEDENIEVMGNTDLDPAIPEITEVYSYSSNVIEVVFSEPVKIKPLDNDKMYIQTRESASNDDYKKYEIADFTTDDDMTFRMKVATPFSESDFLHNKAYFYIEDGFATDVSGRVDVKDEDESGNYVLVPFGINDEVADKIDEIYVDMPDCRTINITYPEAMNASMVKDVSNYAILDDDSTTDEALSGLEFEAAYSTYDADENKATLYLKHDNNNKKLYLAISSDIQNELDTNKVSDKESTIEALGDKSGIILLVADAENDPDVPGLKTPTVSNSRYGISVKFDQDVYFKAVSDGDYSNAFNNNMQFHELNKDNICQALKMNVKFEGESSRKVTKADIKSVTFNNNDFKTINITFNKQLAANSSGTVTTNIDSTDGPSLAFFARTQAQVETDSDADVATFAVGDALYGKLEAATDKVVDLETKVAQLLQNPTDETYTAATDALNVAKGAVNDLLDSDDKDSLLDRVSSAEATITGALSLVNEQKAINAATAKVDALEAIEINAANVSTVETDNYTPAYEAVEALHECDAKTALQVRVSGVLTKITNQKAINAATAKVDALEAIEINAANVLTVETDNYTPANEAVEALHECDAKTALQVRVSGVLTKITNQKAINSATQKVVALEEEEITSVNVDTVEQDYITADAEVKDLHECDEKTDLTTRLAKILKDINEAKPE